jgi:hypothetical protein
MRGPRAALFCSSGGAAAESLRHIFVAIQEGSDGANLQALLSDTRPIYLVNFDQSSSALSSDTVEY